MDQETTQAINNEITNGDNNSDEIDLINFQTTPTISQSCSLNSLETNNQHILDAELDLLPQVLQTHQQNTNGINNNITCDQLIDYPITSESFSDNEIILRDFKSQTLPSKKREKKLRKRSKSLTRVSFSEPKKFIRRNPLRNTVIIRPRFKRATAARATISGFPYSRSDDYDEVIDWSWVYKMEEQDKQAAKEPEEASQPRSWLRSSMRRVKHFQLPDEINVTATNTASMVIPSTTMALRTTHITTTIHNNRPISAPTRLNTEVRRSVRVSSGSDNNVDHTRSSSESSRISNRGHSAASSVIDDSSIYDDDYDESSLETSPSYTPATTSPDNLPTVTSTISSVCERPTIPSPLHQTASTISGNHVQHHHHPPTQQQHHTSQEHHIINNVPRHNRVSHTASSATTGRPPPDGGGGIPEEDTHESKSPIGCWRHRWSSTFASLGCTLGIFNISRFAILSVHFGANFIVQFLVLSLFVGIPLFTLHTCLGVQLGAGVMDMWRISPIFQGVGVALLVTQALIGMYSIIGVSWLFVYFRDSFITKMDNYKWAEPLLPFPTNNGTYKIEETIPDYFNGQVLQRVSTNLLNDDEEVNGSVKFQLCFNLAIVWIIVFACLSKGLKSYGKVVFLFGILPLFALCLLCAKMLGLVPANGTKHGLFNETSWPEFFLNTKCWIAAFQETFLTWGLFAAAAMQIASHNNIKHKRLLQRDTTIVIFITCFVLILIAFLANTCVQVLRLYGYNYLPGSFETAKTAIFMRNIFNPLPPNIASTPVRYMLHSSLILGDRTIRPGVESGYQPLRFATELIPATFTIIGPDQLSPFWAVLFYFVMILFGIAQQLAIWHCVITSIMGIRVKVLKYWQTSITFFSCVISFLLGLFMTTEYGIYSVYFLDYVVGGSWYIAIVYMVLVSAVFMVRGRPYSGETVVTALFHPDSHACLTQWAGPLLSFTWNVVLPVALVVYSISSFKNGNYRELYQWHHGTSLHDYWPLWARQFGTMLQLLPILIIPITAFIQSYRYLTTGSPDILDENDIDEEDYRIQQLYRPTMNSEHLEDLSSYSQSRNHSSNNTAATTAETQFEDPPPKYTPPPSYTTATGARIAKLLRQSIRRSVRRILGGETSEAPIPPPVVTSSPVPPVLPPDYATVLVEMNQISDVPVNPTDHNRMSSLTAAQVANILRSSIRRNNVNSGESSVNLVEGAESINRSLEEDLDQVKHNNLSSVI